MIIKRTIKWAKNGSKLAENLMLDWSHGKTSRWWSKVRAAEDGGAGKNSSEAGMGWWGQDRQEQAHLAVACRMVCKTVLHGTGSSSLRWYMKYSSKVSPIICPIAPPIRIYTSKYRKTSFSVPWVRLRWSYMLPLAMQIRGVRWPEV